MAEVAPLEQIGWSFPPVFERHSRRVPTLTGLDNLAKCLRIMLATSPNERNIHWDYGCDLSGFAFQRLSFELLETIEEIVGNSIENHEPRISINDVAVGPVPGQNNQVFVRVEYTTPEGSLNSTDVLLDLNNIQPVSL